MNLLFPGSRAKFPFLFFSLFRYRTRQLDEVDNPEGVETEGGKGGKERNFSWSDSLMDRESGLTDLFRGGRRAVDCRGDGKPRLYVQMPLSRSL